jgi:N-acetyl-anhydromuramyl-L-alanine amidase AmpD
MLVIPGVHADERMHSHVLQKPLAAPRGGIMLHYDDSSSDREALEWFHDPRCSNGYTWLVLDDGRVVELADPGMRTPHAGACLTPMANSRFYGIAAATNGSVCATAAQVSTIVRLCSAIARFHKWADPVLVGHDEQAVWTAEYTARRSLWGKVGRKVDPTGRRPDGAPVLDVRAVKHSVILSEAKDLHLNPRTEIKK